MKKIFFFLLIALVVFISGCTQSSTINANNGIAVHDFSVDPPTAEATDIVRFSIDAENVGGTTARCITTELFGVDNWRTVDGQPISVFGPIIPTQGLGFHLDFVNGIFSGCYRDVQRGNICVNYNRDRGASLSGFIGSSFIQFSNAFCNNAINSDDQKFLLTKYQSELIPQNPSLGRSGQSFVKDWYLMSPVLPEGAEAVYPVTARTSYFYDTNAIMQIQAFSKEEYKRRVDTGQQTQFPLVVQNSHAAPIQVNVVSGDSPVVVNPLSPTQSFQPVSYKFKFVNVGEGYPLPLQDGDLPGSSGFVIATLAVDGPGAFFSDCLGQKGTEIVIGGNVLNDLLRLRSDQSVPVGCTIGIDRTTWLNKPVGTITFKFNLYYRYYVDRTVNVKVVGVEGLSGQQALGGF